MPFIHKSAKDASAFASEHCTLTWLISPFNRDHNPVAVVYPNTRIS
jgi:hypothetical protein